MIQRVSIVFLVVILLFGCKDETINTSKGNGTYYIGPLNGNERMFINYNVINKEDPTTKLILQLWQDYISQGNYFGENNDYWVSDGYKMPQSFMKGISFNHLQNTVMGVIEVEKEVWELTSMFSSVGDNVVTPMWIVKVYAKKTKKGYKLLSKIEFVKEKLNHEIVGNINYYFDDKHVFSLAAAEKLNDFNIKIAKLLESEPISFDYFISETSKKSEELRGFDFSPGMYVPNQYGALADVDNNIIYVGNDSEYYPHEVVHLYTAKEYRKQYHEWFDEGLAALLGGSRGYPISYHIDKLNTFIDANPKFNLYDITKLQSDIPNGEFTTGFRYVIGAMIIDEIYAKYGTQGFLNTFLRGASTENFYEVVEEILGISKNDFGKYVRELVNKKKETGVLLKL